MLTLPIKKKWFDMILSGEKKEEYREIKRYYDERLLTVFGAIVVGGELLQGENVPKEIRREPIQRIRFRNGYSTKCPSFIAECTLSVGVGRTEWGAEENTRYYILHVKRIVEDTPNAKEE